MGRRCRRATERRAVLVRRRSQIPLLAEALQAAGLPVEIVGLGGLLTTRRSSTSSPRCGCSCEHDAGTALARLLTGARWRVGARDLAALGAERAAAGCARPAEGARQRRTGQPPSEAISIVEALDDLGPAGRVLGRGLSRGWAQLVRASCAGCAGGCPRRCRNSSPTSSARIGVDIEVAARADRARIGRAHLDRFLDEAADFANEADEATLTAFLAFLDAAEDEENGLDAGEVVVEAERVQVLTVHGAKGLEWDVVAVPGLVDGVFPADARSVNWARARQELPGPLRGDRIDLPALDLDGAADRKEVRDAPARAS